MKTIITRWGVRTYDVWGSLEDGWEVNDTRSRGTVELELNVETHNAGTEQEFYSASPDDDVIKPALGLTSGVDIETDGDDVTVFVYRFDGKPLGEMYCVSHSCLSGKYFVAR